MAGLVERDGTGVVAWLAARDNDIAVGALILIEECRLRLEEPVDLLPELADRRVLVDGRGPVDGATVPANRPITLRDVLTFRLGWGLDFEAPWPQRLFEAMSRLEIGGGPPQPQTPPEPDEWLRRLSRPSVEAMTTDHIGAGPGVPGPSPDGSQGWGFGVGVQVRRSSPTSPVGSYGWAGGLGSSWANDPGERLIGVVLTTDMFTGAHPSPAVIQDFWTGLYAAFGD